MLSQITKQSSSLEVPDGPLGGELIREAIREDRRKLRPCLYT